MVVSDTVDWGGLVGDGDGDVFLVGDGDVLGVTGNAWMDEDEVLVTVVSEVMDENDSDAEDTISGGGGGGVDMTTAAGTTTHTAGCDMLC